MRDLPDMPVEVSEATRVPAVEGLRRFAGDLAAVRARSLNHLLDLLARADVVGERDPAPAGSFVGDSHVLGELLPRPEHENDAVCLEERRLLDVERGCPTEAGVEALRALVVGDAERDQRDALLHVDASYSSWRRSQCSRSPSSWRPRGVRSSSP